MRDSITPVQNQQLELHIQTYDAKVRSLEYAVCTLDGGEQLAAETVEDPKETEILSLDGSLLTQERLLLLTLDVDGQEIRYYTRVADGAQFSLPHARPRA